MHPTHSSTAAASPTPVVTTVATSSPTMPAATITPTVRTAEVRTSLLELPNEIIFQIVVHLLKSGYSTFFPTLSNLVRASRRTAEVLEETTLRIHSMHKPSAKDSLWWWTKLQNVVNKQVDAGSDTDLALSAGLNSLLKPGMHLVPHNTRILNTFLATRHARLPCSTITFDIPEIASQSVGPKPSFRSIDPGDYINFIEDFRLSRQDEFCKDINRFLFKNAQMKERPQIFVMWNWDVVGKHDTLRALGCAAEEYENVFLTLESSDAPICQRQIAALVEVLESGKVINVDLNGRSMKDDVAKALIQAIRKVNSVQHLMVRYAASPLTDAHPNWADLLPELNGNESLRKLTVLHWGPVEAIRGHLQNLPDCPHLETVEFCLRISRDQDVADECRKMQELIDTVRSTKKDKFSVTFVVRVI